MKTLIKLLALAVTVGGLLPAHATSVDQGASEVVIAGYVTDAVGGAAISYATVSIDGREVMAYTGMTGGFVLTLPGAVQGTDLVVEATAPGYDAVRHTVRIEGSSLRIDFALSASPREREEAAAGEPKGWRRLLPLRTRSADMAADAVAMEALSAYPGATPASVLSGRYDPDFHTESYAHVVENAFLSPSTNPLSTFSIDVDRASYANVRRFITAGERPPIDAVRIEELINYFAYQYPEVRGEHPFAVHTEVARAPWNERHLLVKIGIQGKRLDLSELPPSNLVFLLDVSGSMSSPDKLPLLKQAFGLLVEELRPEDRVAIVVYAGAAGLVLDSTPGNRKHEILAALAELEAGGSTAGGAGIRLAYRVAQDNFIPGGNNRVILATDGDFNIGESSDAAMIRLIEKKREEGAFLTVLGFGTGNLKDSKMEQIADHGNGNFAYIDGLMEAKKVLVSEMGGTLFTIAKDVKLQVELNPAAVEAYRLIGYENRLLAKEDFNDDAKDAGDLGAGHTVTALYEVVPKGVDDVRIRSVDPLRYSEQPGEAPTDFSEGSKELMYVKLRYKQPDGERSRLMTHPVGAQVREASEDLGFASAVAGFGMLLRDSEHCGDWDLADAIALARASRGLDREGYRAEFIRLVETTHLLELTSG